MKHYTHFFALLLATVLMANFAHGQTINTVAGNGTAGYSGDGGAATTAELYAPVAVAFDGACNMYIADNSNSCIRKVTPSGIITTVAGNGTSGYSGDGGAATAAILYKPCGVTVDGIGNIYIADNYNSRIRKVAASGIITTIAGNGTSGFSGDGGAATAAALSGPAHIAVDGIGNLYIADEGNHRIRKISMSGTITTIAGKSTHGYSGDGGPATAAELNYPRGVNVDDSGNVYIAEQSNNRIRKVVPSGIISTIAGNGSYSYSGDGGPATAAGIQYPDDVAVDGSGNIYIADYGNHRIRKVVPSGTISTIAGNGTSGYSGDGGAATAAEIALPYGVSVDGSGNVYIADGYNNRIRKVGSTISRVAIISGIDSLCPGLTATFTDTSTGGTWVSANPAIATVNSSGTVTSVAPGVVNILYVVTNSCVSDTAFFPFKVRSVASCSDGIENIPYQSTFAISPNPNNGTFTVYFSGAGNEKVPLTVTNLLGKKVKESIVTANTSSEFRLDVPSGVYFISAATRNGVVMQKVVVAE